MDQIIGVFKDNKNTRIVLSGSYADVFWCVLELLNTIGEESPELVYAIYEKLKEWRENDGQIPI